LTRDCTIITNGTNYLKVYIDGNMVYSSNTLKLLMQEPFNAFLEPQSSYAGQLLNGTFNDYYVTASENVKVTNNPSSAATVKIVDSSGNVKTSVGVVSGNATLIIGKFHFPLVAYIKVYDSLGNQLASTSSPVNIFGGDVYSVNPIGSGGTPAPTTLTLNSISYPPWGKNVTVTGQLTINSSSTGIGGKTITFSGTGAANLQPVTTNPDGTFSVSGASPNTVAAGWQVNANFAGDSTYSTSSASRSYNTLIHSTSLTLSISPSSVAANGTYSVSGTLTDTTTGTTLSSKTISFSATSPITIPSTYTNSTGKYLVSGLRAPSTAGSYNIKALFAGSSLYTPYSTTRTLSVTSTTSTTTLTLNTITSVPWSSNVIVTGQLTATSSGTGIGGKTITFSGTGAAKLQPVTTNPDGTFSVTGASPNTVAAGWQVNANFAGDSTYGSSFVVSSYNTIRHAVSLTLIISPSSVVHSGTFSVSGTLTDTTTGTTLSSKTISFSAASPIIISSTTTGSTGKYLVSGLIAPSISGSYSIKSQFNGGSFYNTYSVTRTLSVT